MGRLIIAKPGFDALTEQNPNNKNYDSLYDTLKYFLSGTVSVSVAGASAETTVDHNLGYIPFFVAFVDLISPSYNMCPGKVANFSGYVDADVYADITKLYCKVHTDYNTNTFNFHYKIFRNDLGL